MAGKIGSFFAIIFSVVMMVVAAVIFAAAGILYENPGVLILGITVAIAAAVLLICALVKKSREKTGPEPAVEDKTAAQPVELIFLLLMIVIVMWIMSIVFKLYFLLPFVFIGAIFLVKELFDRFRRDKEDG